MGAGGKEHRKAEWRVAYKRWMREAAELVGGSEVDTSLFRATMTAAGQAVKNSSNWFMFRTFFIFIVIFMTVSWTPG